MPKIYLEGSCLWNGPIHNLRESLLQEFAQMHFYFTELMMVSLHLCLHLEFWATLRHTGCHSLKPSCVREVTVWSLILHLSFLPELFYLTLRAQRCSSFIQSSRIHAALSFFLLDGCLFQALSWMITKLLMQYEVEQGTESHLPSLALEADTSLAAQRQSCRKRAWRCWSISDKKEGVRGGSAKREVSGRGSLVQA